MHTCSKLFFKFLKVVSKISFVAINVFMDRRSFPELPYLLILTVHSFRKLDGKPTYRTQLTYAMYSKNVLQVPYSLVLLYVLCFLYFSVCEITLIVYCNLPKLSDYFFCFQQIVATAVNQCTLYSLEFLS